MQCFVGLRHAQMHFILGGTTLLQCCALLLGEGGAVSVLDTFGFLVIVAHCLKHLSLIDFFLNQRLKICTDTR